MGRPIVAILYDFDKTLSVTDMQNFSFIPAVGMTPEEFWGETTKFSQKTGCEKILSYMYMMIKCANDKGIKISREFLQSCGKNIKYFPGVSTWFKRINEYGDSRGVKVEHYLVSSGTKEIVEGCSIANEFTELFGCEYLYDENGNAIWPKLAINYTQKTQFLFRIAKGVGDMNDEEGVNRKTKNYRVPYSNILYVGDGMTDVACMTLVKRNGGRAVAVYPEGQIESVKGMYQDGRVDFVCKADYSAGSDIEKVIRMHIDDVALNNDMQKKQLSLLNK